MRNIFARHNLLSRALHGLFFGAAIASTWLTQCHTAWAVPLTWNLAGGGDWDTTTANWSPGPTTFTDGDSATFSNTAGGSINITAPRAPLSTTVSATSGTYTFGGSDLTSGGLIKSGGGTIVLNSAITAGSMAVTGGTIRLGASERLPNNANSGNYASWTFDMNGFDETLGGLTGFPIVMNMGNLVLTGSDDIAGGYMSGPGSLTIASGGHTFRRDAGNPNTYSGGTFINGGNLQLYNGTDILPVTGAVTVNSPGIFNLDFYNGGTQETIGALNGNGNITTSTNNASGTPFRIGNGGGSGTYSGVYSGNGSLTKLGGGIQNLNGNNTYTGPTTINGGTLRVNGTTGAGQGNYTVNNTGTLGGSGTINLLAGNAVTVANGGTLAPGNSAGTLTINGDLILNSGSFLDFELGSAINPATSDHVVLGGSGNLTLDGTLNITRLPGFIGGNFTLFTYTGALVDNGLIVLDGEFLVNTDTPGIVFLQFVPVPEPSTFALLGLGVVGLAIKRRRTRSISAGDFEKNVAGGL